jgi:hypothetical protein
MLNTFHPQNIGWHYYIFYCVFLSFECVVIYFLYVETRYVPLEEVTKLFDGEDVAAATTAELKNIPVQGTHVEEVSEVATKV